MRVAWPRAGLRGARRRERNAFARTLPRRRRRLRLEACAGNKDVVDVTRCWQALTPRRPSLRRSPPPVASASATARAGRRCWRFQGVLGSRAGGAEDAGRVRLRWAWPARHVAAWRSLAWGGTRPVEPFHCVGALLPAIMLRLWRGGVRLRRAPLSARGAARSAAVSQPPGCFATGSARAYRVRGAPARSQRGCRRTPRRCPAAARLREALEAARLGARSLQRRLRGASRRQPRWLRTRAWQPPPARRHREAAAAAAVRCALAAASNGEPPGWCGATTTSGAPVVPLLALPRLAHL